MRSIAFLFLSFLLAVVLSDPSFAASAPPPQRIISLAPNMTEILFAMGAGDRVVGVTSFCDFPEAAKDKAKVGGMSNPSLEAVVSLKPDIVIMTTDGNLPEFEKRLRSLKIRTYVFRARKLAELPGGIRNLGVSLGMQKEADTLARKIASGIDKYRYARLALAADRNEVQKRGGADSLHHRPLPRKVLFVIWPEPLVVAGSGTEIDDAITLLGHINVASKAKVSYPRYSVEEILRHPPDVILIGRGHSDMRAMSRPLLEKLSRLPAVRNRKVFFLSDRLYRLGPRVVQGVEEMAECLN